MSAPAFGSIGTKLGASGSTPAFTVPASVASGDIIVVAFYAQGSGTTITALPSGFAAAENSPRTVNAGGTGSHAIHVAWKRATGSDTGTYQFTLSAAVFVYGNAVRYTGCVASGNPWDSPTSAADGGNAILTTAPAVSVTTAGADRMLVYVASDESGDGGTWTQPTGFNQRQGGANATNCEIADLVQAVAGSSGNLSATITAGGADRMGAWLGALIGTTGGAPDIPPPATRTVQARDAGESWWGQRDRRDANTVATAADLLPSPLDVAYGVGGAIWHQRGGAADAAPRTWAAQQRTYSDPSLLAAAAVAPPPAQQRTVPVRDSGEAQWLQQPRRDQITTALLENELLGGAEWITRVTSPVTNAPRWWMPQQPRRDATTPGLLDGALLEGPLLAGDLHRHGHAAVYTDRREAPAQRPYISDPSFYPTIAPTDPLTVAWGAGGTYWLLYNTAAVTVDRREVPQHRLYQSDPSLLATALLEPPLLGGADTTRHLVWSTDRREVPQQRAYVSDPAFYPTSAVADPLTVAYGAGGAYWQLYNAAAVNTDRRRAPRQRSYLSDPALLASALLEDVLLGSGDTARHATWYSDRRNMPQQRVYNDSTLLASALLEDVLLGGGDAARHAYFVTDRRQVPRQQPRYVFDSPADPLVLTGDLWRHAALAATHASRRTTVPQRIALVFVGLPAPETVKATSTSSVTASHGSTAAVGAGRTSTAAVTARRTSTGGIA